MADVKLSRVGKSFGKTKVIHGIDCAIPDGEFVVVLGPSGCGKSTLLRLIAGLETISEGQVFIGGKKVNDLEPADRDIAMVFQNYALYPHMTVYKNMAYGLKIRRFSKAEIDKRVRSAAATLELADLLHRKPRQLSGGQRQRVAMGRCIVREPQVFLFDEPLSNLDAKLRVQMRLELRNLHERLKVTSIYVTHDQVEAMTLGDRLIVLKDGYVEQIGTPLEVYQYPQTQFVAGFIGSPAMNFISGWMAAKSAKVVVDGQVAFSLSGVPPKTYDQADVIVGIRPEHVSVTQDASGAFGFRVSHTEILGADTIVYGSLADSTELFTVRMPGIQQIDRKTVLQVVAHPEDIHLFEAADGRRITLSQSARK